MATLSLTALRRHLRRRFGVLPWSESVPDLADWFESPRGRALLAEQRLCLEEALQCLFGYHLLQMSVSDRLDLAAESRVSHRFALTPVASKNSQAVVDFANLPLPAESIDVVLLHHVLDYSQNPHQVLRELNRVLIPRGHLVLVGFNPWSRLAAGHWLARLFSPRARWRHRALSMGRILDWLTLLDLEPVEIRQGFYRPLQRTVPGLSWLERWNKRLSLPWGGFYLIVARKDVVAMAPLKPAWPELAPVPGLGVGSAQRHSHTRHRDLSTPSRGRLRLVK